MPDAAERNANPCADEVLVARARAGDVQAAGELAERYRDAILRFCYAYLGNLHDAEDVAQDVFIAVSAGDLLPEGVFRPWLYRVARNRCLNVLRDRRGGRIAPGVGVSGSHWPSPRTGPRTALLRDEQSEHIRCVIATMPEAHRDVLILRFFEDLSRTEMAAVLDLPESVVKSRVFEAFKKLKERLRETGSRP